MLPINPYKKDKFNILKTRKTKQILKIIPHEFNNKLLFSLVSYKPGQIFHNPNI